MSYNEVEQRFLIPDEHQAQDVHHAKVGAHCKAGYHISQRKSQRGDDKELRGTRQPLAYASPDKVGQVEQIGGDD